MTAILPLTAALIVLGIESAPELQAGDCAKITFEGVAQLGLIEVMPGVFALGALPTETTIAGIPGLLGSVITSARATGAKGQGAQHYTLVHTFVSTDPARPGWFKTEDRAIGAPAGKDPNVGIINDNMRIVEGAGVCERKRRYEERCHRESRRSYADQLGARPDLRRRSLKITRSRTGFITRKGKRISSTVSLRLALFKMRRLLHVGKRPWPKSTELEREQALFLPAGQTS